MSHTTSDTCQEQAAGPLCALLAWAGLMLATVAASLWSWSRLEGSPTADVVEYLERAQALVRGQGMVDAQPIRGIGVSLLHAPYLWLADALGVAHTGWVLVAASLMHIAITCLFVAATVVLARSFAQSLGQGPGRAQVMGWTAGLVALCCPTLVQFAPIAMSDTPAGAALALGLALALFGPASARRALGSGALFGLSALCAFKAIPLVVLGLGATIAVRGLALGLGGSLRFCGLQLAMIVPWILVQGFADLATFGSFGAGLWAYLLINFGQVGASVAMKLGLVDLATYLYYAAADQYETVTVSGLRAGADTLNARASTFFFDNLRWVLARPIQPLLVMGAVAALVRARGKAIVAPLALMAMAALLALATANKGSTDIRIWLPIVPILSALCALGLGALAGGARGVLARPRAALAVLCLGAGLVQSARTLTLFEGRAYGAFARAARGLAALEPGLARGDAPLKVAASYHWAVLFRTSANWQLTKLPRQLDTLASASDELRRTTFDAMLEQDVLILHVPLLTSPLDPEAPWQRERFELIVENFQVAAAYWDRALVQGPGMVLVLTRETPRGARRRVLSKVTETPQQTGPDALRLERKIMEVHEIFSLADVRASELPGDGVLWLEFDIDRLSPETLVEHYALRLEARDAAGQRGFVELHAPRWGKGRLNLLPQGSRLTEGLPLAPTQGPLDPHLPSEPLGAGGHVTLWFDLATAVMNEARVPEINGRLEPMDPGGRGHAERLDVAPGSLVSDDGFTFKGDSGALLIGTLKRMERQTTLQLEGPLGGQ